MNEDLSFDWGQETFATCGRELVESRCLVVTAWKLEPKRAPAALAIVTVALP